MHGKAIQDGAIQKKDGAERAERKKKIHELYWEIQQARTKEERLEACGKLLALLNSRATARP